MILIGVFRNFLRSRKVGHMFVALPCFPHIAHGGVTLMVGVSCMMGAFNVCWVVPLVLGLRAPDEDSETKLVLAGAFNLGWVIPPTLGLEPTYGGLEEG